MADDVADNFDPFAENYHTILSRSVKKTGAGSEYYCEYKVRAVRAMVDQNDGSILDFGCGDGTTAAFFRKYFPSHHVTGIDISQKSIDVASGRKIPDCELKTFDGKAIPYSNNSFSIVFMANVLHHVPRQDVPGILQECRRVLQAQGHVIIFEHNPYNQITRKIVRECVFDRDALLLTHRYLRKMLVGAGYESVRTSFHLFFPRHRSLNIFLGLEKYLRAVPLGGQYCTQASEGCRSGSEEDTVHGPKEGRHQLERPLGPVGDAIICNPTAKEIREVSHGL